MEQAPAQPQRPSDTYWLTRFVMLRWLGFVYFFAYLTAVRQLVPLVGTNGLTPASLFFDQIREHVGSSWAGFELLPSIFWINCSDAWLQTVPWIGLILSCVLLAGYANAPMLAVLWVLYLSIVHAGQDWYGYGWEIQMLETGFLSIFLCPLLDARPFPLRPPPLTVIFLFRWLIVRIMLGSALIKLRGDSCWRDFTALYTFFETQPIPNPISRLFHFLPHPLLQFGVGMTYLVELIAPWFVFWPRWGRYMAGALMIGFQLTLIISGNFSFFNWLTILPALACFDDRAWERILPVRLVAWANQARQQSRPSTAMIVTGWAVTAVIVLLSIQPVLNLLSANQMMNTSFDRLHLVNTYGAFGSVGKERAVLVFEGTESANPDTATDWKEYHCVALPDDLNRAPIQIAPYQPHLDWQLWFAAMGRPDDYPWTLNLVWKLLHNDPATLGLMGPNPFPDHPPRYIRCVLYIYHFAQPGNPEHVYWTRDRLGLWLPALSTDNADFTAFLRAQKWIP
ncbi:MAG: lipase maturation factor family protein [Methylacidiphilales bacterium]|nr:lipase maturation factor family protein [Candidatus Methylacidiphilales bacterium]